MIHTVFPTNIFLNDYEKSNEWFTNLENDINTFKKIGMYQENFDGNLFKKEIIEHSTNIKDLFDIFVEGLFHLSKSYEMNLSTDEISDRLLNECDNNFSEMKRGDYVMTHNHPGMSVFGIFYFTDLTSDDGGHLVLRDPSFNSHQEFCNPSFQKIAVKKGRLILCPSYVWHEVEPLNSNTRKQFILNMFMSESKEIRPERLQDLKPI